MKLDNLNRFQLSRPATLPSPPPPVPGLISTKSIIICHRVTNGESRGYTYSHTLAIARWQLGNVSIFVRTYVRTYTPPLRDTRHGKTRGTRQRGIFDNAAGEPCPSFEESIARPALRRSGTPPRNCAWRICACACGKEISLSLSLASFRRACVLLFFFFHSLKSLYRVWSLCPVGPCLHLAPCNLQPTDRQVSGHARRCSGGFRSRPRILATGNQFLMATRARCRSSRNGNARPPRRGSPSTRGVEDGRRRRASRLFRVSPTFPHRESGKQRDT